MLGQHHQVNGSLDGPTKTGGVVCSKTSESDTMADKSDNNLTLNGEEGAASDNEIHSELNSEVSDAATLEQRRAFKLNCRLSSTLCL